MTTRIRNERWVTILGDCCGRIFQLRGSYDDATLRFKTALSLDDKRSLASCARSIIEIARETAILAEKTRNDIIDHFKLEVDEPLEIKREVDLYKVSSVNAAACMANNEFFKILVELQQKIGRDFFDAVSLAQSYLIDGKPTVVEKYLELVLGMLRDVRFVALKIELIAMDVEEILKNGVL